MHIQVDPSSLTQEQREAVAGFILSYPSAVKYIGTPAPIEVTPEEDAAFNELDKLQHDQDSTLPVAAFGAPVVDEAAAAFGAAVAPIPFTPDGSAPPPPANTAPTPTTHGHVSSDAHASLVDSKGLPWDARIHAESKNKIADGTWRNKRNLDPAFKAQVEAELLGVMAAPSAPTPAPTAPAAPPAPQAPPPLALAPAARAAFVALIGRTAAAVSGGKITQQEVTQCCNDYGIPALPLLATRLDLVDAVAAKIDAIVAGRG